MRITVLSALLLGALPFHAQAFDFAIGNFTVLRDGSTLFTDSFAETTPPAAPKFNNGNTASYTLPAGSFSPAVNGKLHLNSAAATISPAVSTKLGVAAHLNSNTDAANTTIGQPMTDGDSWGCASARQRFSPKNVISMTRVM